MAISLQDLFDDGNVSMREQAEANNLPYDVFTMRELITPQYRVDVTSKGGVEWSNWVGEHEEERKRHRPSTKEKLISSVVKRALSGEQVRAVGSGHSHSNVPEPPDDYIDLNPGGPDRRGRGPGSTGTEEGGINSTLDNKNYAWLRKESDLEQDGQLDESHTVEHLKRLEAGTILRRLNRHILHPNGFALENMGSFDGQTIAGAVNTSTHGTGVGLGSLADSVRSVEIATVPESEAGEPIVRMYRIEPTDGITDRRTFESDTGDHEMELIQDDDIFRSVVVGYGCLGVVYAYTMEVTDDYWLREETSLMPWSELKADLNKNGVEDFLTRDGCRHVMILVNTAAEQVPKNKLIDSPWEDPGEHEDYRDPVCLVRRQYKYNRDPYKPVDWDNGIADERWPPERRKTTARDIGQEIVNQLHPLKLNKPKAKQIHKRFFHPTHRRKPFVKKKQVTAWYVALRRTRDSGDKDSPEYRHPEPPQPAPTTEIGVQLDDLVDAVDAVREKVRSVEQGTDIPASEKNDRAIGRDVFFGAPMGLRFTAPSEHFLSPEFERQTAMVEVPLPVNREGNETNAFWRTNIPALNQDEMRDWVVEPALDKIESHLLDNFEARPHMGKHNNVDADWLDETYEYFDATDTEEVDTGWYQAYQRFNAFGTFDNKFTDEQLRLHSFSPAEETDETPEDDHDTTAPTETSTPTAQSTENDTDTPTPTRTDVSTAADGPGFNILTGLAGAGSAAWALHRHLRKEEKVPENESKETSNDKKGETVDDGAVETDSESTDSDAGN
jgi:hypothetical protein